VRIWAFPSLAVTTVKTLSTVRGYPLQYVEMSVAGHECVALEDSGCQIPIVSNRLFGWCREGAIGNVDLHGFGKDHTIQAPLVNLSVCLRGDACGCDVTSEIPLVCAVTELSTTDYDVILPAALVRELHAIDVSVSTLALDTEDVRYATEADLTDNVVDAGEVSVDKSHPYDSGFTTVRSLFCHQNPVEGQPVSQLCVPQGLGISVVCRITVWLTCIIMVLVMCMQARSCVNGCAVTNMCDVEFDHVLTSAADVLSCGLFSYLVDDNHWTHLEASQRQEQEQLRLLDELQDRFAVSPDLCDSAVYRIQTTSEFFRVRCDRIAFLMR